MPDWFAHHLLFQQLLVWYGAEQMREQTLWQPQKHFHWLRRANHALSQAHYDLGFERPTDSRSEYRQPTVGLQVTDVYQLVDAYVGAVGSLARQHRLQRVVMTTVCFWDQSPNVFRGPLENGHM